MADKPIVWSKRAERDQLELMIYWAEHNGTTTYSEWLLENFYALASQISKNPLIGRPTIFENVRMKSVRKYQLFYEEKEDCIEILLIWDQRRDPKKLRKSFR